MNKNSGLWVYPCIQLYLYLVRGLFLYDFQNSIFPEQHLVSAGHD